MTKGTTQPTILPATHKTTQNCTDVTLYCPVDQTIYGYAPNLGANVFFAVFFFICMGINLLASIRYKAWTYLIALVFGSLTEGLGYIGRIMLHSNPWSSTGFEIQICCLIIAPAFMAAGVYLTLKHIVLEIGSEFSRIPAKRYTWIFISCDLLSLILQGAGGGIAASADPGSSSQDTGNDLMMAGIVWQVITLLVFGALVVDYTIRARKNSVQFSPAAVKLSQSGKFKLFIAGLVLAYFTIFIRCVYRIAEMAGGWSNSIMQDETEFIVLDGVMVAVATACLTAFHPGWMFPPMQLHNATSPKGEFSSADAEKVVGTDTPPSGSEDGGRPKKGGIGGYFGRH